MPAATILYRQRHVRKEPPESYHIELDKNQPASRRRAPRDSATLAARRAERGDVLRPRRSFRSCPGTATAGARSDDGESGRGHTSRRGARSESGLRPARWDERGFLTPGAIHARSKAPRPDHRHRLGRRPRPGIVAAVPSRLATSRSTSRPRRRSQSSRADGQPIGRSEAHAVDGRQAGGAVSREGRLPMQAADAKVQVTVETKRSAAARPAVTRPPMPRGDQGRGVDARPPAEWVADLRDARRLPTPTGSSASTLTRPRVEALQVAGGGRLLYSIDLVGCR